MNITELFSIGAINTPWPIVTQNGLVNGSIIKQSQFCEKKCGRLPRCQIATRPGEGVCEFGLSFFSLDVCGFSVTIYGVRGGSNPNTSSPSLKQILKGRSVTLGEVLEWKASIERLDEAINNDFLRRQSELLDPLHDPIRLARQIQNIAVSMLPAGVISQEEKIRRASSDLKSLIKASDLLNDYFQLLSIYFNPASASFGKKTFISLHGLLLKLVAILGISDENDEGGETKIYLNGESYRTFQLFESFKLIPLALISNAVKYRASGVVRVGLHERQDSVEVSVDSDGPLIEPSEYGSIFMRRQRGKWASKVSSGTGVGLYLADIVARAHGIEIKVNSVPSGTIVEGVPQAHNKFWFVLPLKNERQKKAP